MLVCVHVRVRVCIYKVQECLFMSLFSAFITWVPGQTQAIGREEKHLHLLSHRTGLQHLSFHTGDTSKSTC